MKFGIKQRGIGACVATAAASVLFALPAGAAPMGGNGEPTPIVAGTTSSTIKIVDSGTTANGGWVAYTGTGVITIDGTNGTQKGDMSTQGVESVGGGTWSFGTSINWIGQKNCYSQYMHESVGHGSSVSMAGIGDSAWSKAGVVAASKVTALTLATCYANWRK